MRRPHHARALAGVGQSGGGEQFKRTIRQKQQLIRRLKLKLDAASAELKALRDGKVRESAHRTTAHFLTKVALSRPSMSARSFDDTWVDLVGTGASGCSRTTVSKIRSCFAEVLKKQSLQQVRSSAAASARATAASRAPGGVVSVVFVHIHDEACLRLRSAGEADLAGGPSRSRSSKVQAHVARVAFAPASSVKLLCELEALADKRAATLATSLLGVLRAVAAQVGEGFLAEPSSAMRWFFHIVVGDGVGTNLAAVKRLLAAVKDEPLNNMTYFVMCVKCCAHQCNLAISSAVSGRTALCSAQHTAALCADENAFAARPTKSTTTAPHARACGVIVRLFKYLVSDYYSEFCMSLTKRVGQLRASVGDADDAARTRWGGLAKLYGESVFPQGLLECLNLGADTWEHRYAPGEDVPAASGAVHQRLAEVLRSRLLVVDEHPTLTRMFTFTPHVDALLLVCFLGIAEDLFRVQGVEPRPENQTRLVKVLRFLASPESWQWLRRASLSLRICDHVQRSCEKVRSEDSDPLLVRLAKGDVQELVDTDLRKVLSDLHLDERLDVGAAVTQLLGVATELTLRYREYSEYPYALYKIIREYNRSGYMALSVTARSIFASHPS